MKKIDLKKYDIDPCVFFLGTDEDIQQAEDTEKATEDRLKVIITAKNFHALQYTTESGQKRILHHSTRPGAQFQLSYIGSDGIPVMHELYISDGTQSKSAVDTEADLYRHFTGLLYSEDITLEII